MEVTFCHFAMFFFQPCCKADVAGVEGHRAVIVDKKLNGLSETFSFGCGSDASIDPHWQFRRWPRVLGLHHSCSYLMPTKSSPVVSRSIGLEGRKLFVLTSDDIGTQTVVWKGINSVDKAPQMIHFPTAPKGKERLCNTRHTRIDGTSSSMSESM